MSTPGRAHLRAATASDSAQLVALWAAVFSEPATEAQTPWRRRAHEWFTGIVEDPGLARFPVIAVGSEVVATAIGTLELGVPNPHCPRGRTVRLANVFTAPAHRGRGYGTLVVHDVIEWARSIEADRVDLSATPDGQRLYERAGFAPTSAPRLKLVL